jgi:hypothetical protein
MELERQPELFKQANLSPGSQCPESVCFLPVEQVDQKAGAMGLSYFHFF